MKVSKATGSRAGVYKYDIITALGTFALSSDKAQQKRVFRFLTLMTARYNWQGDTLSVGQVEIARLWNVDTRTVKREMARLRAMGWLELKRQGARGHVSIYGINFIKITNDTAPYWEKVGSDFDARMSGSNAGGLEPKNVVPLHTNKRSEPPSPEGQGPWPLAKLALYNDDAAFYGAWIANLEEGRKEANALVLLAPSKFHASYLNTHVKDRLLNALKAYDPEIDRIRIDIKTV